MHGAKERSQREALAECWRSQREALAEPAQTSWLRKGISAERCAHCALHSSTWCSSDLKDGCPLETCSSQDRDSLPPRVGLRSDAVMSNLLSSPQTPGGTAVSCYATSLPLPLSPSSSRPFPVRASVTSLKKKRDEKHSHVLYYSCTPGSLPSFKLKSLLQGALLRRAHDVKSGNVPKMDSCRNES